MEAIARYSDSAEDLDTVVYFLVFHEIRAPPRKMQYLVIDCLVIEHQAQFASQNPLSSKFPLAKKYNPCPGAPLRYCKR